MYKKPSRFGVFWGALASLTAHAAVFGVAAVMLAPEPKPPKPFALRALKTIMSREGIELQQSSRLVCASFPFVCEEELFVELQIEELKDDVVDPIDKKLEDLTATQTPEKPADLKPVPKIEVKPEEEKKEEKIPDDALALVEPPPPVIQPKERLKSVDQIVEKEDKFNPDAQFLAEKTKVVEENTQAKVTSDHIMDKEAKAVSDPSAVQEKEEAGAEEKKVASVQENRAAPNENKSQVFKENKVDPVAAVVAPPGQKKEGLKGDKGEKDPTEAVALDPDNPGDIAAANPKLIGEGGQEGIGEKGLGKGDKLDPFKKKGQPRLSLTMSDVQQIYGKSEGAKEGQEEAVAFTKGGKSKREKFVMAQLENYLPEVKPGNQTALSTAADPFAKFLHQVHLRIHKKWGDGALREFDAMGGSNPMNNPLLQLTIEIAINPDGTLEKAAPIGSSTYLPYDMAVITAVYDAGPFPTSPEAIRSYNGKVYLRWTLHRDNRQCATSFAEPYIIAGVEPKTSAKPATPNATSQPAN